MITLTRKPKIVEVPDHLMPKQNRPYPSDNEIPFEEWFFKKYDPDKNISDRIYLPIQWTAFFCNNKHGRDRKMMNKMQMFLDVLDKSKKYFTVVQYDDGILNSTKGLDLKIFGTGCKGDVQLPLVCQPHKYEFKETTRPIFASFIGAITHPIRQKMVDELKGREGYFISTELTSLHTYCYIMSQSKYALCPRGYGKTSFRIQEAFQYGAKPIYISDEHLFGVGCLCVKNISEAIEVIAQCPITWPTAERESFEQFYTYEAVAKMIYENL